MKVSPKLGLILIPLAALALILSVAYTALGQSYSAMYLDESFQGISMEPAGSWGWVEGGSNSTSISFTPIQGQTGTLVMADPNGPSSCKTVKTITFSGMFKISRPGNNGISVTAVDSQGKTWFVTKIIADRIRDWFPVSLQIAGLKETKDIALYAFASSGDGQILIDQLALSEECDDPPVILPTPTPQPTPSPTPCPARAAITGEHQGLPKIDGVKTVQLLFLPHLERGEENTDGGC